MTCEMGSSEDEHDLDLLVERQLIKLGEKDKLHAEMGAEDRTAGKEITGKGSQRRKQCREQSRR